MAYRTPHEWTKREWQRFWIRGLLDQIQALAVKYSRYADEDRLNEFAYKPNFHAELAIIADRLEQLLEITPAPFRQKKLIGESDDES